MLPVLLGLAIGGAVVLMVDMAGNTDPLRTLLTSAAFVAMWAACK